jgi:hypothetical protein
VQILQDGQVARRRAALRRLPFIPQRVGAWWNNEEEIDLVAVGEEALLVGECKWTGRPVGTNILDDLKRKAHVLAASERTATVSKPNASLTAAAQAGVRPALHYALFARSFTPALEVIAGDEGILLVGPDDLLAPPPIVGAT